MTDPMTRIAVAIERLADRFATNVPTTDPTTGHWFVWHAAGLVPVPAPRTTPLAFYAGVEAQQEQLLENARRHALGLPAHDVLLWGARGMGKSSLVRAVHASLATGHNVALVQVTQSDLGDLPALFRLLAPVPRRFTIFLDDVSLDGDDAVGAATIHVLRSLLDGGVMALPDNVRLAVTSNRRNLVPSQFADASAVNPRDNSDDRLALADRFGLRLGFNACDQDTYLAICASYATAHGLAFDPAAALTWAAGRGARSGRVAWQFTIETAGAQGLRLA
jgi:hypothetical protein